MAISLLESRSLRKMKQNWDCRIAAPDPISIAEISANVIVKVKKMYCCCVDIIGQIEIIKKVGLTYLPLIFFFEGLIL